jgi:predicted nucleic acid-binding protein
VWAVADEIAPSLRVVPGWIDVRDDFPSPAWSRKLDVGERAAIALALHVAADFIVLDDLAGRTVAAELGLTAIGSFGLLVRAKRSGLIREVRPLIDAKIAHGNYASDALRHHILALAGELDAAG